MIAESLLDRLSVTEKAELFEALREELSQRPEVIPMPDWHKEVLAERRRLDETGEAIWLDLEEVKRNLHAWRQDRA